MLEARPDGIPRDIVPTPPLHVYKGARVEKPEMRKEKVEKEPTKLHRNADEESGPLLKEKMEKVREEVDGLPP